MCLLPRLPFGTLSLLTLTSAATPVLFHFFLVLLLLFFLNLLTEMAVVDWFAQPLDHFVLFIGVHGHIASPESLASLR